MVGSGRNMDSESWSYLLEGLDRWNMRSLKIAGMEPTLHPHLASLISATQSFDMTDLSMTTNGTKLEPMLCDLIENGLNRLTVSFHTLNPFIFKKITHGGILPVLEALDACYDFGIPTKLNVVLLRGVNDDIRDLLEFASIRQFEVKLYPLLWQPHFRSDYNRFFIGWDEVIQPLACDWKGTELVEFTDAQRFRYTLETDDGVKVTTSWFDKKVNSKLQLCRNCSLNSKCEEGFMGYGFETDSNLVLNPCYLRPQLRIDLKPYLKRKYSRMLSCLDEIITSGG
jgi:cyclic pyranopterin phosphate synthase